MDVIFGEKRKYLYEYSFYQVIRDFNETATFGADARPPILTSEARRLHASLLEEIAKMGEATNRPGLAMNGTEPDTRFSPPDFAALANAVLYGRMGYAPYGDMSDGRGNGVLKQHSREFVAVTGMAHNQMSVSGDNLAIPLSPFDERFADREAFWTNGSELLWAKVDDFANIADIGHTIDEALASGSRFTPGYLNMDKKVYRRYDGPEGVEFRARTENLTTKSDVSGVSAFRPYMLSDDEFRAVRSAANSPFYDYDNGGIHVCERTNEAIPFHLAVREARRNALAGAAVLADLMRSGRPYEVRTGRYSGQVEVFDEDSRMSMRLIDEPGQSQYAGRIVDTGAGVSYLTRLSAQEGMGDESRHARMPRSEYTPELATRMFRWACGREATMADGTPVGDFNTRLTDNRGRLVHASYYAQGSGVTVAVGRTQRQVGNRTPQPAFIQLSANYSDYEVSVQQFQGEQGAEKALAFIEESVHAARQRFIEDVDLPGLIAEAEQFGDVDGYRPDFELNGTVTDEVADVRSDLWEVLTNPELTLLDPAIDKDTLLTPEDVQFAGIGFSADTPAEKAELYLSMYVDEFVGSYEPEFDGSWFDLNGVARYTPEGSEQSMRQDLISAMRTTDMGVETLKGTSRSTSAADSLRRFNEDMQPLTSLVDMEEGTRKRAMETVRDSLRRNFCEVNDEDIVMDNHGIIRYTAQRTNVQMVDPALDNGEHMGVDGKFNSTSITGTLGPVFEHTAQGTYITDFAGSENVELVPTMRGFAVPSEDGGDIWQRLRGRSFEDRLMDRISSQVADDVRRAKQGWSFTGRDDSLLREWRESDYISAMPLNRAEVAAEMDIDTEWFERFDNARVATEALRVSFGSEVTDNASVIEHYKRRNYDDPGQRFNDNGGDLYRHMGSMNWAVPPAESDQFFSRDRASSANSHSHTRYMRVPGVLSVDKPPVVAPAGSDVPLLSEDLDLFDYNEFDAQNRMWMATQNAFDALGVTKPAMTAYCTMGNWVDEDAVVISSEMAERYPVPYAHDADGTVHVRPLGPGDKMSDFHGNKGVVALVVDRNMSDEEARELGIYDEVAMFKANPELSVVMNNSATLSRNNAGTLREAIGREGKTDLALPDGGSVKDGLVNMRFCIHDKTAEKKTGIARSTAKFGWQERVLMRSLGAEALTMEADGGGTQEAATRERLAEALLCSTGATVSNNKMVRESMAERNRLDLPDTTEFEQRATDRTKKNERVATRGIKSRLRKDFLRTLERSGGYMEVPFELTMPTMSVMVDELPDGITENTEGVKARTRFGQDVWQMSIGGEPLQPASSGTWLVPVASRSLREGFVKKDTGETVHSNLTGRYSRLYAASLDWLEADWREQEAQVTGDVDEIAAQTAVKSRAQTRAQRELDGIATELTNVLFDGKHNIGKADAFTGKLRGATNAIWSPDPRLAPDAVAVSPALAEKMGIEDGDTVTLRRHPVLKGGNVLALKAQIDERLIGVAVHPGLASTLSGDFDGDTVVIHRPSNGFALREAERLLSPSEFLADRSSGRDADGIRGLNFGFGGDTAVSLADDPELAQRVDKLRVDATRYADARDAGQTPVDVSNGSLMEELDGILRDSRAGQVGQAAVSFTNALTCMESLHDEVVARGVKGSDKKMKEELAHAMGVEFDYKVDADGSTHIDHDTFVDHGKTLITRHDDEGVMLATVAKQVYTGFPGKEMQRVGASFGDDPKAMGAGLRLVEKLYQDTLDWKHYGAKAEREMPFIDCAKEILAGHMVDMGENGEGNGRVIRNEDKDAEKVDRERFIEQVKWCWGDKLGQTFDEADVRTLADAMAARGSDGMVAGVRELTDKADMLTRLAFKDKESYSELIVGVLRNEEVLAGPYFEQYADVQSKADEKAARDAFGMGMTPEHLPQDTREGYQPSHKRNSNLVAGHKMVRDMEESNPGISMNEFFGGKAKQRAEKRANNPFGVVAIDQSIATTPSQEVSGGYVD